MLGTLFSESRIVLLFLVSGLLSSGLSVVNDLVLYSEGNTYYFSRILMSQATGTLLFAAVAVVFRKKLLFKARTLVCFIFCLS